MLENFIALGAYFNIYSGIALFVYWYAFAIFLPYAELSTSLSLLVENRNWAWINWLGASGAAAGLLGQASILIFQGAAATALAAYGFYIAVLGTLMLIGTMLWESLLWPILVGTDESLLDFDGPIYTSRSFLPFFILAGLIYAFGYVLVGIAIVRTGIFPSSAGIMLAVGAPAFSFGSFFGKYQVYPRSLGVTLISIALVRLGFSMLS